jgi:general L-amino acid transport system substrate-binding protein
MVRKNSKITSVKQLNNSTICVIQGTGTEINLRDYFKNNNLKYNVLTFSDVDTNISTYDSGRCDAYTNDRSQLFGLKQKLKKPDDHFILPEVISKEPLGPFININDKNFEDIVRWTLYVMLEAEEQGVTSKNIDTFKYSDNPIVQRLLNINVNTNIPLNLFNDWSYNIIKQVGNYEEIFERNLGSESPLKLDRGINKLWNKGGIMYSPPLK